MRAMLALAFGLFAGACDHAAAPVAPSVVTAPQVYSQVRGSVLDTAGRDLAGVSVEIMDGPQAGMSLLSTSDRDASRCPSPQPTSATLRATKDGYVTVSKTLPLTNCPTTCPATITAGVQFTLAMLENVRLQAGPYALTWITDSACTGIPEDVRTRTYTVTVTPGINDPGYLVDAGAAGGFGIGLGLEATSEMPK